MTWRTIVGSRRKAGVMVVLAIGLAAMTAWVVRGVIIGPDADPGGRNLSALRVMARALPSDARVLYRYDSEPKWDSCGGRPGTFGWDPVRVQIHFESRGGTVAVLQRADQTLRRLGWSRHYVNDQTTFIQVGWTRRLDNGSLATVQLSQAAPEPGATTPRWDLFATAPAVGPPSSGC